METRLDSMECRTVFIGGIHVKSSIKDVSEYVARFGSIQSIEIPFNKQAGTIKGYAKVIMQSPQAAYKFVSSNNHVIKGLKVGV